MSSENNLENLRVAKTVEERLGLLAPIDFEKLYTGDSLRATGEYGGLEAVKGGYERLLTFIEKFRKEAEEGRNFDPEIVQRAEDSLEVLQGINAGRDLSGLDKKVAQIIAEDVLRRARSLRDAGQLDENNKGTINVIYSEVMDLLKKGLVDGHQALHFEDQFPLALTAQKVKEIEKFMNRGAEIQKQVQIKKKK